MNEKLEFNHIFYNKWNNSNIIIEKNGILKVKEEDFRIIDKIEETDYLYRKAVVELEQSDLRKLIKVWETQINEYLKGIGLSPITILYGNKIYPKTIIHNPTDASVIKIKSVWISKGEKAFPQLWLE